MQGVSGNPVPDDDFIIIDHLERFESMKVDLEEEDSTLGPVGDPIVCVSIGASEVDKPN